MSPRRGGFTGTGFLLAWAALLTLVAGCGSGRKTLVRVFEDEAGRMVDLSVGDTLEVHLASNPNTGYHWAWADSTDPTLQQLGPSYFERYREGIGGSGTEIFLFRAMTAGEADLRMVYKRPMRSDVAERQLTFPLAIKPPPR
jgi:predicted secreted protein